MTEGDQKSEYLERVMALSEEYFEVTFGKNGFTIKDIFGDYQLNKYDRSSSDRLILVAHAG